MRGLRAAFVVLWISLGLSAVMIPGARATWVADGVALSPDASNYEPSIISDGASGTIIAWHGGTGSDIFARRLLADGTPAAGWPVTAPLLVCGATGLQEQPVLVTDGAQGALMFWQDARNGSNYDIYGQRINSSGGIPSSSNWVANGNPISTVTGNQYTPVAVSDRAGGAIIVWQDGRQGGGNYDIYAQRVDGDGNRLWAPAGVPVCVAANNQINPSIVADGSGGAYIAWQDYRKGNEYDIYVQHLTASGAIGPDTRWTTNGVGVCVATNSQFYPVLAGDGAGGVFVTWQDFRTGGDNHIYAQHLSATAVVVANWPVNGTPVCQAQYSQYFPVVASDGATGLFVAWQDYRTGTTNHIYAQHLTAGNTVWVNDGVPISTASNGQFAPQIAHDGAGGAFITWYDSRGSTNDVYIQQVNNAGVLNPVWDRDGLGICLAPNTQQYPVITTNAAGSAIMTWQDLRSGSVATAAIYAQQAVNPTQVAVGDPPLVPTQLGAPRPNPFRETSEVQLTLAEPASVRAEVLDITGRRIATLASGHLPAGTHMLRWDGTTARGQHAAPGVYLIRVQSPGLQRTLRVVRLR
jgi:hypothetical protein